MRLASVFSSLFASAALLAACSSSSGNGSTADGGPATDAASDAASTEDAAHADAPSDAGATHDAAGDAAAACNSVANVAKAVTIQQIAQDPPAPQGGTISDGTYTLTDVTVYTGPAGLTGPSGTSRVTIQLAAGTIQVASDGTPATQTVTLATSGTTFTATDTCPDANVTKGGYTATATTFVVFLDGGTDDAGARTLVETFTKQ